MNVIEIGVDPDTEKLWDINVNSWVMTFLINSQQNFETPGNCHYIEPLRELGRRFFNTQKFMDFFYDRPFNLPEGVDRWKA